MFLSEWRQFPSAPCLAGRNAWWQLAYPCCWNRARPWHDFQLVSFLVGIMTYQHPGSKVCILYVFGYIDMYVGVSACVFGWLVNVWLVGECLVGWWVFGWLVSVWLVGECLVGWWVFGWLVSVWLVGECLFGWWMLPVKLVKSKSTFMDRTAASYETVSGLLLIA